MSTDQPSLSFDRPLEQKRGVDNTIFPTPSSTLSLVEEIEQPSTTTTTPFDSSHSVLRHKYMESPGSIRPRLRRGESERAHRHNNFHSYDHRYSTTALSRLVKDAVPFMKGSSEYSRNHYASMTNMNDSNSFDNPHIMLRAASRFFEEVRESKGQAWLESRNSAPVEENADGMSDEDSEDDGILQIGSFRKEDNELVRVRDAEEEEQEQVEFSVSSRGRLISLVDWVLGIEQDQGICAMSNKPLSTDTKHLTERERILNRDEAQSHVIDPAWFLGALSNYF